MNNYDKSATLFERLPVDIFLEIFDFLSLREVKISFFGLNNRFNSAIRSMKCAILTINNNDNEAVDLLHLFSAQIGRLIITRAVTVDLVLCINLRSLTIKDATSKQLDDIRPKSFPRLEILHINGLDVFAVDTTKKINNLFGIILSNGFPRLRICTATQVGPLERRRIWKRSPALQYLQLDSATGKIRDEIYFVCPNLLSFKSSLPSVSCSFSTYSGRNKRIFKEIQELKQCEFEKKRFILDYCSMFHSGEPPLNFSEAPTITRLFDTKDEFFILLRILPDKDPYCFASFLIKFTIPNDYPFKPPIIRFLDPIYHPNVRANGRHCCCWGFVDKQWSPAHTIMKSIDETIGIIDDPELHEHNDIDITREYRYNYQKFYDKALKYTLQYGRPRN